MRARTPALLCALALSSACRPAEPSPPRVVILVIDGVRLDESFATWDSDLTGEPARSSLQRVVDELLPQGTLVLPTYNMGTTITAPAHTAMFTGVRQPLANFSVDEGPGLYRPSFPTLGEELRRQTQATRDESMVMANADLIWPLEWSLTPGYGEDLASDWFFVAVAPGESQPASDDTSVMVSIELEMRDVSRRLVLANLKEVDRKGHYGEDRWEYTGAVAELDTPIIELWERLQSDSSYAGDTVLIITSDHGRHRIEDNPEWDDDYWRNHGDASAGDREVPLLILGPGVRQGQVVEAPHTLEDIAPTAAALLGIELPWARGVPIAEALEEPVDWARSGVGAVAADGDYLVEERFELGDPYRRSGIWWGERRLSSAEAFASEAPAVVDTGAGGLACWREIALDEHFMPWVPRCALLDEGGGVTEIAAPEAQVGPHWRPRLRVVSDARGEPRVRMTYIHNPDDIAELGVDEDVAPREARWNGTRWAVRALAEPSTYYPTDLSAAELGEDQSLWVYTANTGDSEARYSRRVYTQEQEWTGDALRSGPPHRLTPDELVPEGLYREEHPVLRPGGEGDRLELAMNSYTVDTRQIWRLVSEDGGRSWSAPEVVVDDPGLYTHLGPVWMGDRLAWVAYDGRSAEVCAEGDGAPHCIRLDTDRVADLAWDGALLHVVRGNPDGSWSRVALSL